MPYLRPGHEPGQPLKALDLDSLDMMELLMVIDEVFGVRLGDQDLENFETIDQLAEFIARRAAPPPPTS